jgi:nucleoside-diphosphate kinase
MELTLAIVKPDAVANGFAGKIIDRVIGEGFKIGGLKMLHLTKAQAQGFYVVHKERPFYGSLTDFMSSGPIIVMALAAEDAIAKWRKVMGATDPAEADAGTIRKLYGENKERNATHGSDATETANFELGFFFSALEIAGR